MDLTPKDFEVKTLGECKFESPLNLSHVRGDGIADYTNDQASVAYQVSLEPDVEVRSDLRMERAGPRENIFFDPAMVPSV